MKNIYLILFVFSVTIFSCKFDEQIDPNNPSLSGVLEDATVSQLNNLVVGALSQMRPELNNFYDETGVIGREIYRFSGSDPRWVADLLSGSLDNNAFYTTRNWGSRYRTIKNCNILMASAMNTGAISDAERQGYIGFAKTIMANEYAAMIMMRYTQLRTDVSDPDNLGPLVSRNDAIDYAIGLLGEAADALNGSEFAMSLNAGFEDFNSPSSFVTYTQGLKARLQAMKEDWNGVLSSINGSFVEPDITLLKFGPKYSFSSGSGDQPNPMFLPLGGSGENRLAHPSFIEDILADDSRINKVSLRIDTVNVSGLSGRYDVSLYASSSSSIPIIKNEELILLRAEANLNLTNIGLAIDDINIIRSGYGLADYAGDMTFDAVLDELLYQRRYSLYYEGHRWNDLLRYNKGVEIPLDRQGDILHTEFPVPFAEG